LQSVVIIYRLAGELGAEHIDAFDSKVENLGLYWLRLPNETP
jgi:hypothetical protein